jgi:hypothetical protein
LGLARLGRGCYLDRTQSKQLDLFGTSSPVREQPRDEIVAIYRAASLALVKAAEVMPWNDMLTIIRGDNAFRFRKDVLPAAEGAALWAEFNVEMDRLYAIVNAGKDPNPDPID